MKIQSFGILRQTSLIDEVDKHIEELFLKGYSVIENIIDPEELVIARKRLDTVYAQQVSELSENILESINELYMVRLPFIYDDYFIRLLKKEKLVKLLEKILGSYFILSLQNGIINMPRQPHHQNSWHRDLPYQDFTISKPIAISALYCLDEFNESTGGTIVMQATHKTDIMPSTEYIKNNSYQIVAPAGSVILFDSMLFHKAGYNSSEQIRRGINHMFTSPIIKQQISLPDALQGKFKDDPYLRMLLGYDIAPSKSVSDWRTNRIAKLK